MVYRFECGKQLEGSVSCVEYLAKLRIRTRKNRDMLFHT